MKRPPASDTPAAPRLSTTRRSADRQALLDDREWYQLDVDEDLSGETIHRLDVAECRLANTRLVGCDLQGARWVDSVLTGCDLSGALLQDAVLTRVELRDCRLSGLVLNGSKLRDVQIVDCRADDLGLRAITAERFTCRSVLMPSADLASAVLRVTRLFDCDLTGCDVSNIVCDDVRLHGSTLAGVRGVSSLRNVTIAAEQALEIGTALMAAHGIDVDAEREPGRRNSS